MISIEIVCYVHFRNSKKFLKSNFFMPLMNIPSAAYLYSDYALAEISRKYINTGQDAFRHVLPRVLN